MLANASETRTSPLASTKNKMLKITFISIN